MPNKYQKNNVYIFKIENRNILISDQYKKMIENTEWALSGKDGRREKTREKKYKFASLPLNHLVLVWNTN